MKKLEQQLAEEEKRREILEQKQQLELAKKKLQDQMEAEQFKDLDKAREIMSEIKKSFLKYNNNENLGPTQRQQIQEASQQIDAILLNIEKQRQNIQTKNFLVGSLNMLNSQIQQLQDTLSMQRAAPVLTVSADPKVTVFSRITKINFLCECCCQPVGSIEIKAQREWVKWGMLGLKVLLDFTLSRAVGSLTNVVLQSLGNAAQNQFSDFIDEKTGESCQSYDNLWNDMIAKQNSSEYNDIMTEMKQSIDEMNKQLGTNKVSISEALMTSHLYFTKKIKPGTLEMAHEYLAEREKVVWQNFSNQEQENIRKVLKETENSNIYTSLLTLKNGVYICKSCENWIRELEDAQSLSMVK